MLTKRTLVTTTLIVAFGTILSLTATAVRLIPPAKQERFTAFSFEHPMDLPVAAKVGETLTIPLAVENREGGQRTYQVVVSLDHVVVFHTGWRSVPNGGDWSALIKFVTPHSGPSQSVTFALMIDNQTHPYRSLEFFVDVRT